MQSFDFEELILYWFFYFSGETDRSEKKYSKNQTKIYIITAVVESVQNTSRTEWIVACWIPYRWFGTVKNISRFVILDGSLSTGLNNNKKYIYRILPKVRRACLTRQQRAFQCCIQSNRMQPAVSGMAPTECKMVRKK